MGYTPYERTDKFDVWEREDLMLSAKLKFDIEQILDKTVVACLSVDNNIIVEVIGEIDSTKLKAIQWKFFIEGIGAVKKNRIILILKEKKGHGF